MATTVRTQVYYVTEIDTQHPVGVYEAATSYQATTLAAYEWSVSPDQLTAQEMPALPGRYASLSNRRSRQAGPAPSSRPTGDPGTSAP